MRFAAFKSDDLMIPEMLSERSGFISWYINIELKQEKRMGSQSSSGFKR